MSIYSMPTISAPIAYSSKVINVWKPPTTWTMDSKWQPSGEYKINSVDSNIVVNVTVWTKWCMGARQQVTKGRHFGYRHLGCRNLGFVKQITYGTLTESIASFEP